jgi:putative transcriptional regulator
MLINPLDYSITELNKLKPAKGHLLIAEPFMDDPNFKRSVILLTEYKTEGAFGFMLNQKLDLTINDLMADFPTFNAPIYRGGPVDSDSLFYIHTQGKVIENSQHIADDLYWAGNFDQLKEMISNQEIFPNEIMFFIGYSGWDFEQLTQEIKSDSWLISKLQSANPIQELKQEHIWKKTLKNMGEKCAAMANFPEDPSLN